MGTERAYWVAWQQMPGVGNATIRRLLDHCGTLQAAWEADAGALVEAGCQERKLEAIVAFRRRIEPAALLARLEKRWPTFWTPADSDYPPLLREIPDPPAVLFYRGHRPAPLPPAVAVVGTRRPSAYGLHWAEAIAGALARAGFLVVSGLAMGIDGAAHRAALAGGETMAVLGTGLERIYPYEHTELAERIARRGLLLCEQPPDAECPSGCFARRNRIIAGLSLATIVIEAPERSGALITANLACDYNRELFVLPGPLDSLQSQGALKLIAQGARVICSLEQLLVDLGSHLIRTTPPAPATPLLDEAERRIWECLETASLSFDELAERTGLAGGELASLLLGLELRGLLVQKAGSRYSRACWN